MPNFKGYHKEIALIKSRSERLFYSKEEVYNYLNERVFTHLDFIEDIKDTALEIDLGYNLVFNEITIYLTNVLYELDKTHVNKSRITKVNLAPYIFFRVGIEASLRGKKEQNTFFVQMEEYLKQNKLIVKINNHLKKRL